MKTATLYKYGLHYGEESIVEGNEKSGMLYFSGCHLRCSFCYVPEMSRETDILLPNYEHVLKALKELEDKGAKNFNLISVTHFWPSVLSLVANYATSLPWVIKLSGYEPLSFIRSLILCRHTVLNIDFKVWSSSSATRVGLPSNYGLRAVETILHLHSQALFQWTAAHKLSRGILIRHLWMPGFEEDSYAIFSFLSELKFQGPVNLMTHFINPLQHKLIRPADNFIENCKNITKGKLPLFLMDGEKV